MSRVLAPSRPVKLPGKLADWRRTLSAHYKRLGRLSRLRRFRSALPNSSLQSIADAASPDVVLGVEADGRVIGVLELFKGHDAHAEIGISVEDAYQGKGYGKALFLDGLAAAEHLEVRTADLYFSCENIGIRHLARAAGAQIIQNGADCEANIDIAKCRKCGELPKLVLEN